MSTLSIVATPIGNLEDITLRALTTLSTCDLILCEDTRMTKRLLEHHGINKPLLSYHAHSTLTRVNEIITKLINHKELHLALVSDAGTPGISDPGAELVARVRSECSEQLARQEIKIEAIPGPSAFTGALSIAGVPCADFTFLGFLPHKKGRETLFKEIAQAERTIVFYESPHRIMKTLESLVTHLHEVPRASASQKRLLTRVTVCRELTKVFEEVVSGSALEVRAYFEQHQDKIRGEFVVIISV